MESIRAVAEKGQLCSDVEEIIFGYLYDPSLSFEEKVKLCGGTPELWVYFEKDRTLLELITFAAKYNHFPLIERAIELNQSQYVSIKLYEAGMCGAVEGDHLHLVEWFFRKGVETKRVVFWAGYLGKVRVLEWAKNEKLDDVLGMAMFGAVCGEKHDTIEWIVKNGYTDLSNALASAYMYGTPETLAFLNRLRMESEFRSNV